MDYQYLGTEEQPADMLTKALPRDRFHQHRSAIGIIDTVQDGFAREGVLAIEPQPSD